MNINSAGSTYCYSSTGTFASGITVSSGTLRVCGNLTIASLSFANNSTTANIIVENGGTLTINGDVTFYDKKCIRVYGTLNLNGNTTVAPSSSGLIIEASSGKVYSADKK